MLTPEQQQTLWDEACKDSPQTPGWNRHIRYATSIEAVVTTTLLESISSLTARNTELTVRVSELEAERDRLERYWNEALATHENIDALKSRIAELEQDNTSLRNQNTYQDKALATMGAQLDAAAVYHARLCAAYGIGKGA